MDWNLLLILIVLAVVGVFAVLLYVLHSYNYEAVSVSPAVFRNLQRVKPNKSTYTHVFFSQTGDLELDQIEGICDAYDNNRDEPRVDEIAMLCRLDMVANEMDIKTGEFGVLALPKKFVVVAKLQGLVNNQREMFGFVMCCATRRHGTVGIVVFRGTVSIQDWQADARIKQVPVASVLGPGVPGKVHTGFRDIYSSMQGALMDALAKIQNRYGNMHYVVCTGHSLGAALSTLAAYDIHLRAQRQYMVSLITFGSPRVGNPEFVNGMAKEEIMSYRMANDCDYVTTIPVVDYQHIEKDIQVSITTVDTGLPIEFTNHNLYNYLRDLQPDAEDLSTALAYIRINHKQLYS